jgi:NADH-quinone oxidoreductase subunit H
MGDPFGAIGAWLTGLLTGLGLAPDLARFVLQLLGAVTLGSMTLFLTFFLIWVDRKVLARIQDRLGPNRVGPYGLLQPVADALKLFTKEIITPAGADRLIYFLAPPLAVMSVVAVWAVIPLAPALIGTDINVGVLYIVAVGSIGSLAIMLAGYSSNNKYAMLGAFRTVAQLISYEIPMVLALLIPVMLAGSMGMGAIVEAQTALWYIVLAPIAALIFFISSMAEAGKAPFDLLEAESEIVAGYNIEYSALVFGMFFVGEFLHGFTLAALTVTLFLGGWSGPGAEQFPLLGLVYFMLKTSLVYFVVIWVRGTFPRFRIDQVNDLNWKFITPLALAAVAITALGDKLALAAGWDRGLTLLGANLLLLAAAFFLLRAYAGAVRLRLEAARSPSREALPATAGH